MTIGQILLIKKIDHIYIADTELIENIKNHLIRSSIKKNYVTLANK